MNLTDIQQLMKAFSDSTIFKMNMEWDNLKLQMEKEPVVREAVVQTCNVPLSEPLPQSLPVDCLVAKPMEYEGIAVKSPVVGVFYAASSPNADPYVTVGQYVEKGQILCIIEAMKMMNEIIAPVSGTISCIAVEQEATVEYDQPILFIKE